MRFDPQRGARCFILLAACWAGVLRGAELPALRISDNHRCLVTEDGKPFFWLGDTAWSLFEKLNREDADFYLEHRARNGFTVIQAVLIFEGGIKPNAYGDPQLVKDARGRWDPSQPNEEYFQHVDYIVNKAESLGLYIGMIPVWAGSNVRQDRGLFNLANLDQARGYGEFLGRRYRNKPIVWVLGGDYPPDGAEAVWRKLAEGLADGDGGRHLKTYHPRGGQQSSTWFHQDSWLDFNMIQSGHSRRNRNYEMIARDYAITPVKPVIDGEPGYENITEGLQAASPEIPRLSAADVRRFAYCGVFAGAAGHTYGCNEIYQFWSEGTKSHARWGAEIPWKQALDLPGARQMQYLRRLVESWPMLSRVPDQELIEGDALRTVDRIQACRASDGSYVLVYTASGKPFTVRMDKLAGQSVKAHWHDPRDGTARSIGKFPNRGNLRFEPPTTGPNNDWVLVLATDS